MQPAERQNLFADNLLLGPLYRASPVILRPLCNAPRPRNRRVHAQAQAVKVSSVPEKFAAVEGQQEVSFLESIEPFSSGEREQTFNCQFPKVD